MWLVYPARFEPRWRINDTVMYRDCSRGVELRYGLSAKPFSLKEFRACAPP